MKGDASQLISQAINNDDKRFPGGDQKQVDGSEGNDEQAGMRPLSGEALLDKFDPACEEDLAHARYLRPSEAWPERRHCER